MTIWNKNKYLWRDESSFAIYLKATEDLQVALAKGKFIATDFLNIANNLDDMFQLYENKFGPMEDPLFFFLFAQANAIFLQVGKKFDEICGSRVAYIVNGFKEALNKNMLYPTFDEMILKSIDDTFLQFANEYDKEWYSMNRHKFYPVSNLQ